MTTKAERKAAKKAEREALASRISTNPAEVILGKPDDEEETDSLEEMVEAIGTEKVAEQETVEPEAEQETAEPKEATSLEEMVKNLSPEVREEALRQIAKLRSQAEKNEANKRYVEFDKRMKDPETGIVAWVSSIAKETGVDLAERLIKVAFPKGEGGYTHSALGKKGESNGRTGFPSGWGEAEEVGKDGKVIQKQSSPSKLADKMGLQVEGNHSDQGAPLRGFSV